MTYDSDHSDVHDNNTETFDVIYADNTHNDSIEQDTTDSSTENSTRSITPINDDNDEENTESTAAPLNEHITINAQNLSATHTTTPVAQLHSDSIVVSMLPMPTNSDIWTHTLSSPLKPLTLHTYKSIKQNPTKQCRLQLRINKTFTTPQYTQQYNNTQHKRKLSADGCHYVTESDSSSSDSSDDDSNELLTTVKSTYQFQHCKRQRVQRSIYGNPNTKLHTQYTTNEHDEHDNVSNNDDTDSDDSIIEHTTLYNNLPVTHDGLTTNSETDSVDDVDEESLIPSDLLEVSV